MKNKNKSNVPGYYRTYNNPPKAKKPSNPWLPVYIAGAIVVVVVLVLLLIPRPIDVKGKQFAFDSFDATWSDEATDQSKQEAVEFYKMFSASIGEDVNVDNFLDYFVPNYVNTIISDDTKYYVNFKDDGTVYYLDGTYYYEQSWETITLTSTLTGTKKHLRVQGETLVEETFIVDGIDTVTVWQVQ